MGSPPEPGPYEVTLRNLSLRYRFPQLAIWALAILTARTDSIEAQEPVGSQSGDTNVPVYVSDLILHVEAFKPGREDGAAIVVGWDSGHVYAATARHVVTQGPRNVIGGAPEPGASLAPADSIRVEFESARRFVAAEVDTVSVDLDLALIRVPLEEARSAGFREVIDRVGDSRILGPGSEVSPVGCPGSNCWRAPSPPDRVLASNPIDILFQTNFVQGGSSGGGIFNRWGEVVGLIYRAERPGAYALPMDLVLSRVRDDWGRPVTIRPPAIPRGGYRTSLGLALMTPTAGKGIPDGRLPSGRLTLTTGIDDLMTAHLSLLRIAPGDVGERCPAPARATDPITTVISLRKRIPCEQVVNALMAGIGVRIGTSRMSVAPFAEAGVGRARGRYDIGGVHEFDEVRYLPNFKAVSETAFGFGGGLTAEYILFPRSIASVTLGYWTFQDPFEGANLPAGYDPEMPSLYVGLGFHVGW